MTLDECCREFLIENGKTENEYFKVLQMGISGLREMHMDFSGVPSTVILEVNDNNTVDLPQGYINYVKIAIADRAGNLHSLGLNNDMSFLRAYDNCGVLQPTNQQQAAAVPTNFIEAFEGFADNWRNGEMTGRFFGIGGGNNQNGYYRIDQQHGVIQLQSVNGVGCIVLEYISDLSLVNGRFQVHPFIVEALKNWIYWKALKGNSRAGLGDRQMAKRDYDLSYRVAIRRFTSGNLNEWYEVFRSGNKAAPKF